MSNSKQYILSIDQGTTGSRAIIYNAKGAPKASAYQEFNQYYPKPGWVEHDPLEILSSVQAVIGRALNAARISGKQIQAIGITNQRETAVLWERSSGRPIGRAIVWQDRRTDALCRALKRKGLEPLIRKKTGLLLDPYFSGTKLRWRFDAEPALKKRAQRNEVCFGTIDSWLLYHLTGKSVHATDFTNASRTLLFDLKRKQWDSKLCKLFHVPKSILPQAKPSNSSFGVSQNFKPLPDGIPIRAMMGDQQAALFGQSCYAAGDSKNTYGTGCFLLLNVGSHFTLSRAGLLTTIACNEKGNPVYALEGSIFIAGAAIQWLRDGLQIIDDAAESETIAKRTPDAGDVVVIPALTGLGAPYWRADVRGAIFGITRGTTQQMIIKATLDSIAFQVTEIFNLMVQESGVRIRALKVDGGASQNRYLMQFQANLLNVPVLKTPLSESTAWGAAKLAGLSSGFWANVRSLDRKVRYERFRPQLAALSRKRLLGRWKESIKRLIS
ncbi:MAG: glycerol kinase GlpK [Candidatus Omnitrophica bacterium]|nr:glycerol kinase GlpK [Candidatus Omnitrophota bacterium]